MKTIRVNTFETNSSSTHSLTYIRKQENYLPKGNELKIRFIDTDEEFVLSTLEDKVSYLVAHIINKYKWDEQSYGELIERVTNNYDYKMLEDYIWEHYKKRIVFPEKYNGDIEDIVQINHQLIESDFSEVLRMICDENRDYLGEIFDENKCIEFGRD